ncbi:MAG: M14-type cytosolic carboxypeptidase, partial [Planctomycetota bacterium]
MTMRARKLKVGPAAMSGNGVVLDVRLERNVWIVEFMSEPRNSPERLWFHLECSGAGGRRIRFAWLNAHSCLGTGSAEAMANVRPVVRLDAGDWRRIRKVKVRERRLGGHYLTLTTPRPCRRAAVAFCYPYGPGELQATLKETHGTWDSEAIGLTGKGRELMRVHADAGVQWKGRPGAYVVARQHAGEVPGSWVLDGVLRAVAAEKPRALLRRVEWWAVPFVDLDGAVEGNYGKDTLPIDFNRAWSLTPMRPEVHAIQHDMEYFAQGRKRRFVMD